MVEQSDNEKAQEEIVKSVRDLLTLKLTLPLGNPNLKLVHTNQFLYTELPEDVFELANMDRVAEAMNSRYSRNSGYSLNRWYIEAVTITNNGGDAKMDLELNPFATPLFSYKDAKASYQKAYEDANKSDNNNSKVASVKSDNGSCPGGEGKLIDDLVQSIVGNQTDPLKKAKLIHEWLRTNLNYSKYSNSKTKTPEQAYKRRKSPGINCADTSRLTASMMRSAGLTCYVVHGPWHYWTVIKINGKEYNSDATSHRRYFNQVWKGMSYYAKCGKNPCS